MIKTNLAKSLLLVAALTCLTAITTRADTFTYSGNTMPGPTFARPLQDGSALSTIGTNVAYSVLQFTVSAAGSYNFQSTPNGSGYDNFLLFYVGAFNPAASLNNFGIANDDTGGVGVSSAFTFTLNTGINYFLVTTGFDNNDFSAFTNSITGPGSVTSAAAVPEPITLLLLGSGLTGIAIRMRKRKAA